MPDDLRADGWAALIPRLETALPDYLPGQRWFGGKSRSIRKVSVTDWAESENAALLFLQVHYESGPSENYLAPMIMRDGAMQDALQDDAFCARLLTLKQLPTIHGHIVAQISDPSASSLPVRRGSAEQSNSSIIYGDRLILKLFRRQQPGPNPDIEIGRYLTEETRFDRVPPFAGSIEYIGPSGESSAVAIVQGLVSNEGDGWSWTLKELEHYFENCARASHVGPYLDAAALLGRRTAEMHLALSGATDDPAFSPEPFRAGQIETMADQIREEATRALDLLNRNLSRLRDESLALARSVLDRRAELIDKLRLPTENHDYGKRTRTHGDYHLGQVLRTRDDFVILDFEGEPARPLEQRRARYSPLRDVAGMLRSFSYAPNAALMAHTAAQAKDLASLEPCAETWEETVSSVFLSAWRTTAAQGNFLPHAEEDFRRLLDACLLEKAMYELTYELNNRPAWVRIPLAGILALAA